ncbi:hypothetical protein JHK86_031061 [Glycine max]|nr:hypothetical protein JHK86_031061 [Glycine max]
MRKFDPWPVFFKREWKRNWPFLVGFAVTGALITKLSLGLTEEEAKNSKFVKAHKRHASKFMDSDNRTLFCSYLFQKRDALDSLSKSVSHVLIFSFGGCLPKSG